VSIGGKGSDVLRAIVLDKQGNVYVTGDFQGTVHVGNKTLESAGLRDIIVAKLAPDGAVLWATSTGGTGEDRARGIALDQDGGIRIAGTVDGDADYRYYTANPTYRAFVARFDRDGKLVWTKRVEGVSEGGVGLGVDAKGNAYFCGAFEGTVKLGALTLSDPGGLYGQGQFIAKVDDTGGFVWAVQTKGVVWPGFETGHAMALDDSGAVYLAGETDGTVSVGGQTVTPKQEGLFIARLSSDGVTRWVRSFGNTEVTPNALATDGESVQVAAFFSGDAAFQSVSLPSSSAGEGHYADDLWLKVSREGYPMALTSPTEGSFAVALGVDSGAGRSCITGMYYFSSTIGGVNAPERGAADAYVGLLNKNGQFVGLATAGGLSWDEAVATAMGPDGGCYAVGSFGDAGTFGGRSLLARGSTDGYVWRISARGLKEGMQ
jgi:hypothetical protein